MNDASIDIDIIPFSDELADYFTQLNTWWLEKYFDIEPVDRQMLANPKQYFIDPGGHIFFAAINGEITGTFALLRESDSVYELSKMAVDEKYQGRKIGNRMMEHCIATASEMHLSKLILYSNTRLEAAIHLYRKYGFQEVPNTHSIFRRANIKMELIITPGAG